MRTRRRRLDLPKTLTAIATAISILGFILKFLMGGKQAVENGAHTFVKRDAGQVTHDSLAARDTIGYPMQRRRR